MARGRLILFKFNSLNRNNHLIQEFNSGHSVVAYGSVETYPAASAVGYSAPSASGYEGSARSSSYDQVERLFAPNPIPDICHRYHRRCLWRKICRVEKISPQDRLSCGEIFHMTNRQLEKCLHMVDMEKYGEKSVMWRNFFTWEMWRQICFVTILAVLSWNLFYCHIRCFAAKDILSRFTRFCVEKNLTNKLCLWRKMDKYQVCTRTLLYLRSFDDDMKTFLIIMMILYSQRKKK